MIVKNIRITKVSSNQAHPANDLIATEEPLEISLRYFEELKIIEKKISITMRTPGSDQESATGFLLTEGIIRSFSDIEEIQAQSENNILIALKKNIFFEAKTLDRNFYTTSSCGVCGKGSIDALKTSSAYSFANNDFKIKASLLYKFPETLRKHQDIFEKTGGLHGCAIFSQEGKLTDIKEDVGRHNALDKLIGTSLMNNLLPLKNKVLLLSGRASFELIQKALMAGISFVAAVGAPSSLAVELAIENNMTLIGFLRADRFNIYNGEQRIQL